jgi:polysaccharide chain length determinant protein (PEP-CTERM system associated)
MREQINLILGYLHGFWRYRWSALLISWILGMLGVVFVLAVPNKYQAKAVVNIDTTSIMGPLLKGLTVKPEETQELDVINKILLSRENLLSVVRETDMDLNVNTPRAKEALIAKLAKEISLKATDAGRRQRQRQTNQIYEISYQAPVPQLAYKVVSVLLNTMMEKLLDSGRIDTAVAQKFLDGQIAEYEERLSAAEKRMASFKKENIGMMPSEKGGYYVRLQSAQDKVDSLNSDLRLARQRYSELTKQLRGEQPILIRDSNVTTSKSQLQTYQDQLQEMLLRYTDKHPDVLALKERIEELKKKEDKQADLGIVTNTSDSSEFNPVYQELRLELSKASIEIEALKLQLSEQMDKVKTLKEHIDAIPGVEAKLAELNRDYEVTRGRHLELVGRRESARMAEVASQSSSEVTIKIIEPPVVPVAPIGPNRPLLLLVALAVALGVGLGWCALRYLLAPTIVNTQQLRQEFEYPVFGRVSYFLAPAIRRRRGMQLVSFLFATFLLTTFYAGIIWKQEQGSYLIRTFIANLDPKILVIEALEKTGFGGG